MQRIILILAMSLAVNSGMVMGSQTLSPVAKPFPAPDFNLKDEDGKSYRLSDYRGKVVVLNFWATWCPPCREEMPSMERAWQKIKDENIVIIGVNVGEDEDAIFAFTGLYPVTFPLPMDKDGAVIKQYPVMGLPTTYVINPAGKVVFSAVGSREWDDETLLDRLRALSRP
ncbi:MAG: hypothetical protein BMS9Abin36_1255 [Gammaproteobacteria bacterium]|nr:MAG: hypothetical protein BMS9Abin36_1255 [Gammaproteobacteria bacterium]